MKGQRVTPIKPCVPYQTNNNPAAAANSKHHDHRVLERRYQDNADNFKPGNPDGHDFYPGERGYLPDGQPVLDRNQLSAADRKAYQASIDAMSHDPKPF